MRNLFQAFFLLTILLPGGDIVMAKTPKNTLAPVAVRRAQDLSLGALKEGNSRFVKGEVKAGLETSGKWAQLKKGQRPWAMVVSCADSRVVPETLFSRKPGEIFVCRVAGNVADSDLVASLEYGAEHLDIPLLVVLGHSSCGAVKAAIERFDGRAGHGTGKPSLSMEGLLGRLEPAVQEMQKLRRAKDLTEDQEVDAVVEANVRNTMRAVLEKSPLLWSLWHEQRLRVVGAVYSLETGKVMFLER
jgi:carbonic anhydrase